MEDMRKASKSLTPPPPPLCMGKESVHNRACTDTETKQNYLSEREYKKPLLWQTPVDQIADGASIFSDFEVYVWSDSPNRQQSCTNGRTFHRKTSVSNNRQQN